MKTKNKKEITEEKISIIIFGIIVLLSIASLLIYFNNKETKISGATTTTQPYISAITITPQNLHIPGGPNCPTDPNTGLTYQAAALLADCGGGNCTGDQKICIKKSTTEPPITDIYLTPPRLHINGGPPCITGYQTIGLITDCETGNCTGDQKICILTTNNITNITTTPSPTPTSTLTPSPSPTPTLTPSPTPTPNLNVAYLINSGYYSYTNPTWTTTLPPAPFQIKGLAGNNNKGPIIFGGNNNTQIAYLNNYTNPTWTQLPNAPFQIQGITGDNLNGPIIYGGNNTQTAYLNNYTNPTWTQLPNAPFQIQGITGNNGDSLVIYGGNNNTQTAYLIIQGYTYCLTCPLQGIWTQLPNAPFQIQGITGNLGFGPIIYGGNSTQLAHLNFSILYPSPNPAWIPLPTAPFQIQGITGEILESPLIYGGNNTQTAYLNSTILFPNSNPTWIELPSAPFQIQGITGDNTNGPLIYGTKQ